MNVRVFNDRQMIVIQFAEFIAAEEGEGQYAEMCDFLGVLQELPPDFSTLERFHNLFTLDELDLLNKMVSFHQTIPQPLTTNNSKYKEIVNKLIQFGIRFLELNIK